MLQYRTAGASPARSFGASAYEVLFGTVLLLAGLVFAAASLFMMVMVLWTGQEDVRALKLLFPAIGIAVAALGCWRIAFRAFRGRGW